MKITNIKPFPVWVGHRNQHIVKVETDEGIYGWGEILGFRVEIGKQAVCRLIQILLKEFGSEHWSDTLS